MIAATTTAAPGASSAPAAPGIPAVPVWVILARHTDPDTVGGWSSRTIFVASDTRPDAEDHIPAGTELVRAETLPASLFATMDRETRERYRWTYRAYLRWQRVRAGEADPDPVYLDAQAYRWARCETVEPTSARRVA